MGENHQKKRHQIPQLCFFFSALLKTFPKKAGYWVVMPSRMQRQFISDRLLVYLIG